MHKTHPSPYRWSLALIALSWMPSTHAACPDDPGCDGDYFVALNVLATFGNDRMQWSVSPVVGRTVVDFTSPQDRDPDHWRIYGRSELTFTPFSVIPDPSSPLGVSGTFDTMALTLSAESGVEHESGLSFEGQSWVGWQLVQGDIDWGVRLMANVDTQWIRIGLPASSFEWKGDLHVYDLPTLDRHNSLELSLDLIEDAPTPGSTNVSFSKGYLNWAVTPVPEPGGLALALSGLLLLATPASCRRLRKTVDTSTQKNRSMSKSSSSAE